MIVFDKYSFQITMSHISQFVPKDSRPNKDRVLTEKQQKFLDSLVSTGGREVTDRCCSSKS